MSQLDVTAIMVQALALNDAEHTPNDVLGFLGSTLMTQDVPAPHIVGAAASMESAGDSLPGVQPVMLAAAAPLTPQQRGQRFIQHINASLTKAICTDFDYCGKKAAVDANIKQYLPQLIQALVKDRVGAAAPAWLTPLLTVFGLANWEAAVAGIAIYAIKTGLDHWCHCPAAAVAPVAAPTA